MIYKRTPFFAVFSFYIIQKGSSPERYSAQLVYCVTRDLWMSEVIVLANQKGGVIKTTTAPYSGDSVSKVLPLRLPERLIYSHILKWKS
ncbi:hypothetical protein D3C73_1432930 [compost metagenome]